MLRNNGNGTFTRRDREEWHGEQGWVGRLGGVRRLSIGTDGSTCTSATTSIYSIEARSRLPGSHRSARLLSAKQLSAAAGPAVPQPRQRHVRGRDTRALVGAARTARRSACRPPTSTATAGSTSTSATTGWPNQLWINQKNGTFKDMAFLSGAAVSGSGNAEASMGIDAGDFDNDGDEDLFITNWLAQMNILYVNAGDGVFEDRKARVGARRSEPCEDRVRHRLVRLRQRLLARPAGCQRERGDDRGAGARARIRSRCGCRISSIATSATAASRMCQRRAASRSTARRRPGRRVRRHRQRRRRRCRDRQRQRPDSSAFVNNIGQSQPLDRPSSDGRHGRATCSERACGSCGPRVRRSCAVRDPMAAMRRPTTPACSSGSAASTDPVTVRVQWPDGTLESWTNQSIDRWTTLRQGTGK